MTRAPGTIPDPLAAALAAAPCRRPGPRRRRRRLRHLGRTMQAPEPGATAPPRRPDPTTTTVAGPNTLVTERPVHADLGRRSRPAGQIPARSTPATASATPPPFTWANVPAGTVELALVDHRPRRRRLRPLVRRRHRPRPPPGSGRRVCPGGHGAAAEQRPARRPTPRSARPPGETHTYDVHALRARRSRRGSPPTPTPPQALTTLASNAIGTAVLTGAYTRTTAN